VKIKANFEIHEMMKCDIKDAIRYHINQVSHMENYSIKKAKPLLRTVLHDYGMENVRIHIRETTDNIIINLETITKDDLKLGDKVYYQGVKRTIRRIHGDQLVLKGDEPGHDILALKEEVMLCL